MNNRVSEAMTVLALALVLAGPGAAGGARAASWLTAAPAPSPGAYRTVGLWDKPNAACETQCEEEIFKACIAQIGAGESAQSRWKKRDTCEDEYSLCLYYCMCENCREERKVKPRARP